MERINRISLKVKIYKRTIFLVAVIIGLIVSLFCVKRYIKNSSSISFDLSAFQEKEGFEYLSDEGALIISPIDVASTTTDICTESEYTFLSKGDYSYCIAYESDCDFKAYVQAGDSVFEEYVLPAGSHIEYLPFYIKQPVIDGRVRVAYGGYGIIKINAVIIESSKPIVSDWLFIMTVMWIAIIFAASIIDSYYEGKLTKGHLKELTFVILVSLLSVPYIILTAKGIFWGIDTNAQNIRIEIIKDAMLQGQFPVVIGPSMCNGFGSIEPVMYPSLFLYPFAILRILKVSPVIVYKFAHIIINLLMCATCYVCAKKITRSCKAAALSLIAFAFSNYHLMMIGHYDWTYGMGIAMIFFFVVLIGLYEIFLGNKEVWPYLSIGMWGILNSHIMTSIFAASVVGLFALFYLKGAIANGRIRQFIYAVLASIPMCIYRIYTFLDAMLNNDLNTSSLNFNMFSGNAYDIKGLFTSPVTFIMLATLIISLIYLLIVPNRNSCGNKFALVSVIITITCIFFTTAYLPWDSIFENKLLGTVFGFIQFPNRLYQVAVPLCCITLGIIYRNILRRSGKQYKAFVLAIFAIVGISSIWSYVSEIRDTSSRELVFSEKIIGDVTSFPGMTDYVPDGENYDSYARRSLIFSDDKISVTDTSYEKQGTNILAEVNCAENNSYIDFPVFAYKGYICKDMNGNEYTTGIGENHRLRVFFEASDRPVYVKIRYKVPAIYFVLLIVSYMSLFAVVTYNTAFLARTKKKLHYYEFLKSFDYRVM